MNANVVFIRARQAYYISYLGHSFAVSMVKLYLLVLKHPSFYRIVIKAPIHICIYFIQAYTLFGFCTVHHLNLVVNFYIKWLMFNLESKPLG